MKDLNNVNDVLLENVICLTTVTDINIRRTSDAGVSYISV